MANTKEIDLDVLQHNINEGFNTLTKAYKGMLKDVLTSIAKSTIDGEKLSMEFASLSEEAKDKVGINKDIDDISELLKETMKNSPSKENLANLVKGLDKILKDL